MFPIYLEKITKNYPVFCTHYKCVVDIRFMRWCFFARCKRGFATDLLYPTLGGVQTGA